MSYLETYSVIYAYFVIHNMSKSLLHEKLRQSIYVQEQAVAVQSLNILVVIGIARTTKLGIVTRVPLPDTHKAVRQL